MKKGLIGVQMSTLKKTLRERGVYGSLKACADLGYHCVEISQIQMTPENIAEVQRACRDFHIKVAATSGFMGPVTSRMQGGEFLPTHLEKFIDQCRQLNTDALRISILPESSIGGYELTVDFARQAEEVAQRLAPHGISLFYHNHNAEFQKYNGKYMLDIIKENSQLLNFELDTHWIQRGGANPVEITRQYAGRIRLYHLKDYRIVVEKHPDSMFDMNIEFAEVGEGNLPMKECIEAALAGGSEMFLIEQDTTYERNELDSLRISRDNLINMGYGDWF